MADWAHNYTTLSDCDSNSGFSRSGSASSIGDSSFANVHGVRCQEITSESGIGAWYRSVDPSLSLKILEQDFLLWFYYVKGKSTAYLSTASDAVRIWVYFGTTAGASDKYVGWDFGGHNEMNTGWQCLRCSGKTGVTFSSGWQDSYYDLPVCRVDFRTNMANANTGNYESPLALDWWHMGNSIICEGGSEIAPLTKNSLLAYDKSIGLGVVEEIGAMIKLNCALTVGDGVGNGHLQLTDGIIINEQLSDEVKHNWRVRDGSSLVLGMYNSGSASNGIQLACLSSRKSDFIVEKDATVLMYRSLLQYWGDVTIGDDANVPYSAKAATLIDMEFDNCDNLIWDRNDLDADNVKIHHSIGVGLTINWDKLTTSRISLFLNEVGLQVNCPSPVTLNGFSIKDSTTSDLVTSSDITFVDSEVDTTLF